MHRLQYEQGTVLEIENEKKTKNRKKSEKKMTRSLRLIGKRYRLDRYFVPEITKTIQNCCTFINRVSLFIGRPARCFSECSVTKADITGKIEIKPLFVSRNQSLMSNLFERMQSGSPFVWVIFLSRKLANELSWN